MTEYRGEQYYILVLPELCMGCRSCDLACAVEHSATKSVYTAPFETPPPIARIMVLAVENYYVPMRCQHCQDAPCVAVCPTKALYRSDEGFVLINPQKCIGCLMCATACPFGHPRLDPHTRTVVKCDFCHTRVKQGLKPACVEACPTSALRFGTLDELMRSVASEKVRALLKGVARAPGLLTVLPAEGVAVEAEKPPVKVSDIKSMYSGVRWE